ncbi:RagB/SusD family nutrient uptake outer membrane protein [Kriegella aquimaris]|uniref:SusD family protein n=1 Tax=Kriegella aquimaris TaxID=192904 RepID=A0A1G9TNS3_9FLAO|nr:RagB/SusD family nutrient uptake outer membrane protein [Kriegella aquimaris]SDM49469.1 SusD family protein [Kriegella aquimaris]
MKNIYLAIVILCLCISCEDVLEEVPKAIAAETFYKTEAEFESALFGAYRQLARSPFHRNYLLINLSQVDYGVGRGSYSSTSNFQGLDPTNIGRTNSMWSAFYLSIRDVNLVIREGSEPDVIVEANILDPLIAEAKFMRAFNYFQLVLNWGGVPLRTEDNISDPDVPRSSIEDVYAKVVEDLEYAEQNLPDNQSMTGRPTKMTAKTLLADVYLNMGSWQNSRDKALEVINSNKYQLVNVSEPDDFYEIFGSNIISTSEEIFYMKYNPLSPNSFVVMLHKDNRDYYYGNGAYAAYVPDSTENKTIAEWDLNDLRRKFNLYNWDIGVGSKTLLYKKFTDPDQGLSCDYPIYRYADLLLIYAEADCRANSGPTVDGMEKLNMIHRRGYGQDPNVSSPEDFNFADYTEESFIDLVLQERLYELFSEHKRFYDLKRTGRLKSTIKDVKGIDFADKQFLWPIPNTEYEYNKAIDEVADQNPGY